MGRSCLSLIGLVVLTSSAMAGCDPPACKAYASIGLRISVTDAANQPVCDATVTARTGGLSETLMPTGGVGGTCTYIGAVDRKGMYTVTVDADGQSKTMKDLNVTSADDCGHVKQVAVTVPLGV